MPLLLLLLAAPPGGGRWTYGGFADDPAPAPPIPKPREPAPAARRWPLPTEPERKRKPEPQPESKPEPPPVDAGWRDPNPWRIPLDRIEPTAAKVTPSPQYQPARANVPLAAPIQMPMYYYYTPAPQPQVWCVGGACYIR
jgi:hypothetical protein